MRTVLSRSLRVIPSVAASLGLMLCPTLAQGQDNSLQRLRIAVSLVQKRLPESVFVDSAAKSVESLDRLAREAPMPPAYLASLQNAANILEEVGKPDSPKDVSDKRVRLVAEDLAVKVRHATLNKTSPYEATFRIFAPGKWTPATGELKLCAIERSGQVIGTVKGGENSFRLPPGIAVVEGEAETLWLSGTVASPGRAEIGAFTFDPFARAEVRWMLSNTAIQNFENTLSATIAVERHEWLNDLVPKAAELRRLNEAKIMPPGYAKVFAGAQRRMERLAGDGIVSPTELQDLREGAEEFGSFANKALAAADWPNRITVIVRVKDRGGQEVNGLEVWHVARGLVGDPTEAEPFGPWSSPTWADLGPFNWIIWTQDPRDQRRKGQEKPLLLSHEAPSTVRVEIDLPSPE